MSRIPLLFWSRSEEWPFSWWNSFRIERNELSAKFALLCIALQELSRITRPWFLSSSWTFHWMGCRLYFIADRLEELVDEDDFRSFWRALERGNFLLLSQLHATILVLWSRCLFPRAGWTDCPHTGPSVIVWSASTFSSVSSSLSTSSTDTGTQLWMDGGPSTGLTVLEFSVPSRPYKTSFPISWVNEPDGRSLTGLSVLDSWVFGFGWILGVFAASSDSWIRFFHPRIFKGNLGRRSRWHTYYLVLNFSRFHHNNFRDTICWECVVKDNGVRSCLMELQSFLQSKIDVDPKYSVLMLLPCFVHVLCKTRCFQVDRVRILMVFVQRFHSRKENCLSVFAQILSSQYRSWIFDGV